MDLAWLQQTPASRDAPAARKVAEQLRAALDTAEVKGALTAIPAIGGTSHQVDAVVQPYAELLGFSSQKTTLFGDYPVALRPDWYRPLGRSSGIILEVERGKAVTNNMDLLDLWKCHICREAHHLFIVVPNVVRRNYGTESVYPRVVTRLATFFATGNETNVRSVAVFGYD